MLPSYCLMQGLLKIWMGAGCRFVQMALKLLYERQLGKDSVLAPYIGSLPQSFGTLLTWTDAELAALQYSSLQQEVLSCACLQLQPASPSSILDTEMKQ